MPINFLGTWEHKENKTGNTGKKHILGNRYKHQNRRNTFREHGYTRKILLGTREHGPPWEALKIVVVDDVMKTGFRS